eukprot:Awhi_evm1s4441
MRSIVTAQQWQTIARRASHARGKRARRRERRRGSEREKPEGEKEKEKKKNHMFLFRVFRFPLSRPSPGRGKGHRMARAPQSSVQRHCLADCEEGRRGQAGMGRDRLREGRWKQVTLKECSLPNSVVVLFQNAASKAKSTTIGGKKLRVWRLLIVGRC